MELRSSIWEPEKNIMPETMIFVIFLKKIYFLIKTKYMGLFTFTTNKPNNTNQSKDQKEKLSK